MHNIIKDEWLSEIMGKNAYKVIVDENREISQDNDSYGLIKDVVGNNVFIYSKISTKCLPYANELMSHGFKLIDTELIFSKLLCFSERATFSGKCTVRFSEKGDRKRVAEIARRNFIFSRFHMDQAIDVSVANCIKSEWVENYYNGARGDAMVVASVGEIIAGFLLLRSCEEKVAIDLIAVDEEYQRKGIASDMILYSQENIDWAEMQVTTQVRNIPSIRLYENIGFRVSHSEYVLHFHE